MYNDRDRRDSNKYSMSEVIIAAGDIKTVAGLVQHTTKDALRLKTCQEPHKKYFLHRISFIVPKYVQKSILRQNKNSPKGVPSQNKLHFICTL